MPNLIDMGYLPKMINCFDCFFVDIKWVCLEFRSLKNNNTSKSGKGPSKNKQMLINIEEIKQRKRVRKENNVAMMISGKTLAVVTFTCQLADR